MNNTENTANNNGYDYVDLGLPSGTLWATCNVGASKPSEYGLYFQWGDTIGYLDTEVGYDCGQIDFTWKNYKWNPSGDGETFTKYTIEGDIALDLEDDAAHANMGGDWHMPSLKQMNELIVNTTSIFATQDGVKGMTFASTKDTSKSIFIPAAGYAWDGSVQGSGDYGGVWSSVLSSDDAILGQNLGFYSGSVYLSNGLRCCGISVRGVISGQNDAPKNNKHNTAMNLVEILKNAPIGTELWSYACGTCYLKEIVEYSDYPIVCKTPTKDGQFQSIAFTKEGKRDTIYPNGQCVLFPSKDNQDWGTFKAKKVKHFEPFQKVLHIDSNNYNKNVWKADLYSHYNKEEDRYYLASGFICRYDEVIPYKGNEDKLGKEVEK